MILVHFILEELASHLPLSPVQQMWAGLKLKPSVVFEMMTPPVSILIYKVKLKSPTLLFAHLLKFEQCRNDIANHDL